MSKTQYNILTECSPSPNSLPPIAFQGKYQVLFLKKKKHFYLFDSEFDLREIETERREREKGKWQNEHCIKPKGWVNVWHTG